MQNAQASSDTLQIAQRASAMLLTLIKEQQ
jgi:hypothetical protein